MNAYICCSYYVLWHIGLTLLTLVSLFNGITTFVGYLIPKPSLQKNTSGNIQPIADKDKRVHSFPKGISP